MAVYKYGDRVPKIGENTYISDSARVIGDVKQKHKDFWTYGKQLYVDLANDYPGKLEKLQ